MSERGIWAKVILNIKESGFMDLHSLCVDIATVAVNDGNFYIYSNNQDAVNQLNTQPFYTNLVASFTTIGYNYNIVVMYRPTTQDLEAQKIAELSKVLG